MGRGNTDNPSPESSKKAQYGCQLAPSLPPGLSFTDVRKQKWTLGKAIGSGGFGDIYLCGKGELCSEESEFVVKLEPHDNGPLFTEMHVLYRLGLEQHRADWTPRSGEVGTVNIPLLHASGSLVFQNVKLRFLVIDRLGSDLDKFFKGGEKPWPFQSVLRVALMVLESLEYVHSKGYAHNDIKAQNLLLGKEDKEKIFLVDFGIACKYRDPHGFHKSDEPDERKAHDGTLEYTSRDAHTGAHSRRGDLETLGYNMVHWAAGSLPWLQELEDPEKVEASKNAYMENVVGFLTKCFGQDKSFPPVLAEYLDYVNDMDFDSEPDYDCLREMFEKCILSMGKSLTGKIAWNKPKPRGKRVKKAEPVAEDDNSKTGIEDDEDSNNGENVRRSRRLAEADKEEEEKEEENDTSNSNWNWESVLSKNPERIMRKKKPVELSEKEADFERRQKESLENPTPEMSRIMKELEELEKLKEEMKDQDQLGEFNKQRTVWLKDRWQAQEEQEARYFTPAMMEIQDRIEGVVREADREQTFEFKPVIKEVETPKVQKKLKKPLNKDGEDLNKSMERVSLGKKVIKKKVKTSQNSESKPLAKQSLRLRKLVRVNYKDTRKVKKKVEEVNSEENKSSVESEATNATNLPIVPRKVSIELQSITKAIQNVLRRDSSDNKEKKNATPDLIKKKAKEIVSKAKKAHLNQKKTSISPVPLPVARRSIPIASPIAIKSAPPPPSTSLFSQTSPNYSNSTDTPQSSLSPSLNLHNNSTEESQSSLKAVDVHSVPQEPLISVQPSNPPASISQEVLSFPVQAESGGNVPSIQNMASSDKSHLDLFFNLAAVPQALPVISSSDPNPPPDSGESGIISSTQPSLSSIAPCSSTITSTLSSLPSCSSTITSTVSSLPSCSSTITSTVSSLPSCSSTITSTVSSLPSCSSTITSTVSSIPSCSSITMTPASSLTPCSSSIAASTTVSSSSTTTTVSPLPLCSSSITTTVSTSVACLSSTNLLSTSSTSACLPSLSSEQSQVKTSDSKTDLNPDQSAESPFDIKVPDKNQLFDSLFDTVIERKPPPTPSRFNIEERLKSKVTTTSSKNSTSNNFQTVLAPPPTYNPTNVTNTRLGKDPPISSLNFEKPAIRTETKLDLSFEDMSDSSDSDEGLAAPVLENILSVLSPQDCNVPSSEDLDSTPSVPDNNSQPVPDKSHFLHLPQNQPKLTLKIKTKDLLEKPSEKRESLSPLRIPKLKIKGNQVNNLPVDVSTPPLKLKILRTNDGSWTTSEKKKKKRKEKHKQKKVKPFLISFIKSPDGRRSPTIVSKKEGSEKENEDFPNIKIKIKKSKTSETLTVQRLKIKPYPERGPKCLSEGHRPREVEREEEELDTPVTVTRFKKKRLVQPVRLTFDTEETMDIVDRIVVPETPKKQPEKQFLQVRQERLSEDSECSVEIAEDLSPPSPEILEVAPSPKPAPEVIDLDDDVIIPEESTLEKEDIIESQTESVDQNPSEPAEARAVTPPSEIDVAIHSILGDSQSSQLGSHNRLDIREADKPLAVSNMEIEDAISSILGGPKPEMPNKIPEFIEPSVPNSETLTSMSSEAEGDKSDLLGKPEQIAESNPDLPLEDDSCATELQNPDPVQSSPDKSVEAEREETISQPSTNVKTSSSTELSEEKKVSSSIFDIEDSNEKDVHTVKTSHLDLSDESSDEDIDEILKNDCTKNPDNVKSSEMFISDESSDEDVIEDSKKQSESPREEVEPTSSAEVMSEKASDVNSLKEEIANEVSKKSVQNTNDVQDERKPDNDINLPIIAHEEDNIEEEAVQDEPSCETGDTVVEKVHQTSEPSYSSKSDINDFEVDEKEKEVSSDLILEEENIRVKEDQENTPEFEEDGSKDDEAPEHQSTEEMRFDITETQSTQSSSDLDLQQVSKDEAKDSENSENIQLENESENLSNTSSTLVGASKDNLDNIQSGENKDENLQDSTTDDKIPESSETQDDHQDSKNCPKDIEEDIKDGSKDIHPAHSNQESDDKVESVPSIEKMVSEPGNVTDLQEGIGGISDSELPVTTAEEHDEPADIPTEEHDEPAVTSTEEHDELAVTSTEEHDELPVTPAEEHELPVINSEEHDELPVTSNEEHAELQVTSNEEHDELPVTSNEEHDELPVTSVEEQDELPATPVEVHEEVPVTPVEKQDELLAIPTEEQDELSLILTEELDEPAVTPVEEQEEVPVTPVEEHDELPVTPVEEQEEVPVTPVEEHDELPVTPVEEHEDIPVTPVEEHEDIPVTPVEEHEEVPVTTTEEHDVAQEIIPVEDEHPSKVTGDHENEEDPVVADKTDTKSKSEGDGNKVDSDVRTAEGFEGEGIENRDNMVGIENNAEDRQDNSTPDIIPDTINDKQFEREDPNIETNLAEDVVDDERNNIDDTNTTDTDGEKMNEESDNKEMIINQNENEIQDVNEELDSKDTIENEVIEDAIFASQEDNIEKGEMEKCEEKLEDTKEVTEAEDESMANIEEKIEKGDIEDDKDKIIESREVTEEDEVMASQEGNIENDEIKDEESKLLEIRDYDDVEKEVDILIPEDESFETTELLTPTPDRKQSRSRTPMTALTPTSESREVSAEKRRKRVNYLEMHTGKTSPCPQVSQASNEKKKIIKANSESPKETKDKVISPVLKNSKIAPTKKRVKKKALSQKVSNNTPDTVETLENNSEEKERNVEANNIADPVRLSIKINQEPLEYFKDISKKVNSVVTYVRINSSFRRQVNSESKPTTGDEEVTESVGKEKNPTPLDGEGSSQSTKTTRNKKAKISASKAVSSTAPRTSRKVTTEGEPSQTEKQEETIVENVVDEEKEKPVMKKKNLKPNLSKKSNKEIPIKRLKSKPVAESKKRTVKTRKMKPVTPSYSPNVEISENQPIEEKINEDTKEKIKMKKKKGMKKETLSKSESIEKKLKVATNIVKSEKTKSRKKELDMLEGVIVSRRLGRNCTKDNEGAEKKESKAARKDPIKLERRPSTQSNSSVKSQKSSTGVKSKPSESQITEDLKMKKTQADIKLKSKRKLKKKADTVATVEEGEPELKQRKIEKLSMKKNEPNKSDLPKPKVGKIKTEDSKQVEVPKVARKLKLKDKVGGKTLGDKKKKIRKEAGRRTRLTGSNTRSTKLHL